MSFKSDIWTCMLHRKDTDVLQKEGLVTGYRYERSRAIEWGCNPSLVTVFHSSSHVQHRHIMLANGVVAVPIHELCCEKGKASKFRAYRCCAVAGVMQTRTWSRGCCCCRWIGRRYRLACRQML